MQRCKVFSYNLNLFISQFSCLVVYVIRKLRFVSEVFNVANYMVVLLIAGTVTAIEAWNSMSIPPIEKL